MCRPENGDGCPGAASTCMSAAILLFLCVGTELMVLRVALLIGLQQACILRSGPLGVFLAS